jgi:hypothetical protein
VTLTYQPDPITIVTYAGQYHNILTMSDSEIKWLFGQLNADPLKNLLNLQAIKAEITRRIPSPQKLALMKVIQQHAGSLVERFEAALGKDNLLLSDLSTGRGSTTSSRVKEGLELALAGRWELPQGPGWPFKVDSMLTGYGSLKYEVKCKSTSNHNYNNCRCDDFLYRAAGKLNGWCKHVCCAYFVAEAQKF